MGSRRDISCCRPPGAAVIDPSRGGDLIAGRVGAFSSLEPRAAVQLTHGMGEHARRYEAVVDAYVADPLCGFGIDSGSARSMFEISRRVADPAQVAAMPAALPVYIAAGEADPVNGGLALLTPLADRYRAAGLDVTVRIYPRARHEILNETNKAEVLADLMCWLDRALAARPR
jgi:alpha-beta hydrolase superfamily lysophospholipase